MKPANDDSLSPCSIMHQVALEQSVKDLATLAIDESIAVSDRKLLIVCRNAELMHNAALGEG